MNPHFFDTPQTQQPGSIEQNKTKQHVWNNSKFLIKKNKDVSLIHSLLVQCSIPCVRIISSIVLELFSLVTTTTKTISFFFGSIKFFSSYIYSIYINDSIFIYCHHFVIVNVSSHTHMSLLFRHFMFRDSHRK